MNSDQADRLIDWYLEGEQERRALSLYHALFIDDGEIVQKIEGGKVKGICRKITDKISQVKARINERFRPKCPHCNGTLVFDGMYYGQPTFECLTCGRKFTE